jgi:hypothetical protein
MLLKVVSKPMIDTGDLNSALQTAKPLFNELQNQYENLPPSAGVKNRGSAARICPR